MLCTSELYAILSCNVFYYLEITPCINKSMFMKCCHSLSRRYKFIHLCFSSFSFHFTYKPFHLSIICMSVTSNIQIQLYWLISIYEPKLFSCFNILKTTDGQIMVLLNSRRYIQSFGLQSWCIIRSHIFTTTRVL